MYHLDIPFQTITNQFLNQDFSGGTVDKNVPVSAADTGSIPGPGGCHKGQNTQAPATELQKPTCLDPCSAIREATGVRSPGPQGWAAPAFHN